MICPRCGAEIDGYPCPECGFPETLKMMKMKKMKARVKAGRSMRMSMRMNRRRSLVMLVLLAALLLLAAGCGGGDADEQAAEETAAETTAAETATEAAGDNWYESILADTAVTADYPYYRLLDINGDGIDELFLSSTEKAFIGAEDKAKLMASVNGEAVTLKEIGGAGGESFSYDASDRSLFYFSRLSGEEHIVKYELKDGRLSEMQTADKYDENHDPQGGNTEDTYYLNGRKVTEAEGDVLWNQYDDRAQAVTYSKDGKGDPAADDDADEPADGDEPDGDD